MRMVLWHAILAILGRFEVEVLKYSMRYSYRSSSRRVDDGAVARRLEVHMDSQPTKSMSSRVR